MRFYWTKKLLPFKSASEKIETVSTRRSKDFYKYWPPRNCNNCLKKLRMKKNSGATGRKKGFVSNIFPQDGKTPSNLRDLSEIERK